MKFKEWLASLETPRDYRKSDGADFADTVALGIIMALIIIVVFI